MVGWAFFSSDNIQWLRRCLTGKQNHPVSVTGILGGIHGHEDELFYMENSHWKFYKFFGFQRTVSFDGCKKIEVWHYKNMNQVAVTLGVVLF
jgi:hypothetical protein